MKKIIYIFLLFVLIFTTESNAQSFLWVKTADYANSEVTGFTGYGIAADPSNNIIVTGQFLDTTYFDSVPLFAKVGGKNAAYQGFVAKYDANGYAIWAKRFGGIGILSNFGKSVATDNDGNIYVTGEIENTVGRTVTFDNTEISNIPLGVPLGSTFLNSFNGAVVAKIKPNGDVEWAKMLNDSTGSGCGYGISIDSFGNCLVCGSFHGKIRFGSDSIYCKVNNSFIAKIDPSGNILWAKKGASSVNAEAHAIFIDKSDNFYIGGFFGSTSSKPDTVNFGSVSLTGRGLFLVKYDNSGNALWAQGSTQSASAQGNSIAVDKSGNVFVSGNSGIISSEIFISKFDASGNPVWYYNAGGAQGGESYGMAIDDNNDIYITGSIKGSGIFSSKTGNSYFTGMGACDIYLTKYGNDGSIKWIKPAGSTFGFGDFGYGVAIDRSGNILLTGNIGTKDIGNPVGNYPMNPGGRFGNIIVHSQGLDAIFIAKLNPNTESETHYWSPANSGISLNNPSDSQPLINSIYSNGTSLFLASDAVNQSIGSAAYGLGGIFRSIDEGKSWVMINNGLSTGDYVNNVFSLNGNLLEAGNRGIYLSTNNGDNWTQTNVSVNVASFTVSGSDIYACGGNSIYKSSDKGSSWNTINSTGLSGASSTVIFSSNNNLFINNTGNSNSGSIFAGIFKSTDNGITWNPINSGLPFKQNYKEKMYPLIYSFTKNGNDIFIASDTNDVNDGGRTGSIYKSTDNGSTWISKSIGLPLKPDGYSAALNSLITTGNTLVAGTSEGIYFSTDNGESWNDFTGDLPTRVSITSITADNQFITVGTAENVWQRSISNITGVYEKANNIIPAEYNLSQNYPNPFNPATTINFQIPVSGKVTIKIYDLLGREVKSLVNEFKIAGKYSVKFNASNLASGVYFYNLRAGNFVQTKKMILTK